MLKNPDAEPYSEESLVDFETHLDSIDSSSYETTAKARSVASELRSFCSEVQLTGLELRELYLILGTVGDEFPEVYEDTDSTLITVLSALGRNRSRMPDFVNRLKVAVEMRKENFEKNGMYNAEDIQDVLGRLTSGDELTVVKYPDGTYQVELSRIGGTSVSGVTVDDLNKALEEIKDQEDTVDATRLRQICLELGVSSPQLKEMYFAATQKKPGAFANSLGRLKLDMEIFTEFRRNSRTRKRFTEQLKEYIESIKEILERGGTVGSHTLEDLESYVQDLDEQVRIRREIDGSFLVERDDNSDS